jgi:hypothetical protein
MKKSKLLFSFLFKYLSVTIFVLAVVVPNTIFAARTEIYKGVAKSNGKIVYTEKHTVSFDDKDRVQTAVTEYFSPDEKLIADLKSNFSKSLTAPEHSFVDHRTQDAHGIRGEGEKVVMYSIHKGGKEKTKVVPAPAPGQDRLLFGCQGMHYYLRENMEMVNEKRQLPLLFLIPGQLDTYDFKLKYIKETANLVDYDVEIDGSFLLRLVAPKLEITYDKEKKQLIRFKGPSNLLDDKGKTQKVEITYEYP